MSGLIMILNSWNSCNSRVGPQTWDDVRVWNSDPTKSYKRQTLCTRAIWLKITTWYDRERVDERFCLFGNDRRQRCVLDSWLRLLCFSFRWNICIDVVLEQALYVISTFLIARNFPRNFTKKNYQTYCIQKPVFKVYKYYKYTYKKHILYIKLFW